MEKFPTFFGLFLGGNFPGFSGFSGTGIKVENPRSNGIFVFFLIVFFSPCGWLFDRKAGRIRKGIFAVVI